MADNIRRIELKLIKDKPSQKKPGSGGRLALVQWAKDGKSISVQLVKSGYWVNENDRQTYHKAKGLGLGDIIDAFGVPEGQKESFWKREKCAELMRNPPAVTAEQASQQTGESETEEVPF